MLAYTRAMSSESVADERDIEKKAPPGRRTCARRSAAKMATTHRPGIARKFFFGHVRIARTLLLVAALLPGNSAFAVSGLQEGKPAPAIRAELLDGGKFETRAELGKVIVINFWATWCKPCREEMPALDAFFRAHRDEGLEVIAISIESRGDMGKVAAAMKGFALRAALASEAETQAYGQIWRVPITFVIDRRGVLRIDGWKFSRPLDSAALNRMVIPLLRESRSAALAEK